MNKLESVAMLLLVILLKADLSRATSGEINGTFADCGGSVHDCLLTDGLNAEFSLSYRFGGILASDGIITSASFSRGTPGVQGCEVKRAYRKCLPPRTPASARCRDAYFRGC